MVFLVSISKAVFLLSTRATIKNQQLKKTVGFLLFGGRFWPLGEKKTTPTPWSQITPWGGFFGRLRAGFFSRRDYRGNTNAKSLRLKLRAAERLSLGTKVGPGTKASPGTKVSPGTKLFQAIASPGTNVSPGSKVSPGIKVRPGTKLVPGPKIVPGPKLAWFI